MSVLGVPGYAAATFTPASQAPRAIASLPIIGRAPSGARDFPVSIVAARVIVWLVLSTVEWPPPEKEFFRQCRAAIEDPPLIVRILIQLGTPAA